MSPSKRSAQVWAPLRQRVPSRAGVGNGADELALADKPRVQIAELLRHQPNASLALFQLQGFRHKWMHELHLEGLRVVAGCALSPIDLIPGFIPARATRRSPNPKRPAA
jgi:hypothetical protein